MNRKMFNFHQEFNWHDNTGRCQFYYGKNGKMEIDGSGVGISCYRKIKYPLTDESSSVELVLSVVIGKPYGIRFYAQDSNSESHVAIISLLIDPQGWILIRKDNEWMRTGGFLTLFGDPVVDPDFYCHYWYHWWSDYLTIGLDKLNLNQKKARINICHASNEVDCQEEPHSLKMANLVTIDVDMEFNDRVETINKVELYSESRNSGTLVRLKKYRQLVNFQEADSEKFLIDWHPITAVPDGYPQDNACHTLTRPIDCRWLETETWYGWVTAKIPCLTKGVISFVMMADNPDVEAFLQLGSYQEDFLHRSTLDINLGILEGAFKLAWSSERNIDFTKYSHVLDKNFATPTQQEWLTIDPQTYARKQYFIELRWDAFQKYFQLVVNGQEVLYSDGHDKFPLSKKFSGVSAVSLHPGWAGSRMTMNEKKRGFPLFAKPSYIKPQKAYWADITISGEYDLEFKGLPALPPTIF